MKRLFKVVNPDGSTSYFEKKEAAKSWRNIQRLRFFGVKGVSINSIVVRRGPDHWRGETEGS